MRNAASNAAFAGIQSKRLAPCDGDVPGRFSARAENVTPESVMTLASRGWRLLPCAERGKTPLISGWPTRASSDPRIISEWAREYPRCNWATLCGEHFWVLDVDGESGKELVCSLVEKWKVWSTTLAALTGRGTHLYFNLPNGHGIPTSTARLGQGVDIRSTGSYAIVPPSLHVSGIPYSWVEPRQAIANPPEWLVEMLSKRTTPAVGIGILPQGRRNDGLTRLAGAMRRRNAPEAEIQTTLLEHNSRRCSPPLPEPEVLKIASSVMRYAPGGPDPLKIAWEATAKQAYASRYERFLALARQLQLARPGQPVALPLERIAELLECDYTLVRRYRTRAASAGLLQLAVAYVPHKRAAQYIVSTVLLGNPCPTRASVLLNSPTSGLVGHPCRDPLVGHPHSVIPRVWETPTFTEMGGAA